MTNSIISIDPQMNTTTAKPLFGKFGSIILFITVLVLFFITQVLALVMATYMVIPQVFEKGFNHALVVASTNGNVFSVSLIITALCIIFLLIAIVKLRKQKLAKYLPMSAIKAKVALKVFTLWFVFLIALELLSKLLNRNPMAFLDDIYSSANPVWLLALTITIAGPIYEELIFRGLLWKTTAEQFISQRTGAIIATLITGFIFAVMHIQYGLFEIVSIFIMAMILGYARYRSGSMVLPIALHIFNNGVSFLQLSLAQLIVTF